MVVAPLSHLLFLSSSLFHHAIQPQLLQTTSYSTVYNAFCVCNTVMLFFHPLDHICFYNFFSLFLYLLSLYLLCIFLVILSSFLFLLSAYSFLLCFFFTCIFSLFYCLIFFNTKLLFLCRDRSWKGSRQLLFLLLILILL